MSNYPPNMTLRPLVAWTQPETRYRQRSQFSAPWSATLELLDREVYHLGNGRRHPDSVLQIALREQDFRIDGMPRANSIPSHPGVILNIESSKGPLSFPCDKFDRWQDNLRAIALGLEALRKVDRYGITPGDEQYQGWRAIESKPSVDVVSAACATIARIAWPYERSENRDEWAQKIATDANIGPTTLRKARRNAHPDVNGGDQALWDEVETAAAALRAAGIGWIS